MRWLVPEALVALLLARLALAFVPFRRIAAWMGTEGKETDAEETATMEARALEIGAAVSLVARHVPWDSRCLAQALAGSSMLGRRNIPATLYFGVRKELGVDFSAHAWLRCGSRIITGGPQHESFEVIARFARPRKVTGS